MTTPLRTRFAPSPTGHLHLGNVRTALFSWLAARASGGTFVLRIEDTDAARNAAHYDADLVEDLAWLGLDWDEGPDRGGGHAPYRQSERSAIYADDYIRLEHAGLAYPCYCSDQALAIERRSQLAAGHPPRYSGRCRNLSADTRAAHAREGTRPALRYRVPEGKAITFVDRVRGPQRFLTDDIGDFIIRRADGAPAFFFCNAVDDARMGITLVLRGEDHLSNTPRQLMLQQALGLDSPEYGHLPLILGAEGAPLSKRNGALALRSLREQGYLPAAVVQYLARLGHTYPEAPEHLDATREMLVAHFRIEHIHHAPARFDAVQLGHYQHVAVRGLDAEALWRWCIQAMDGSGVPVDRKYEFADAVRGNVLFPADAAAWATRLFGAHIKLDDDARGILDDTAGRFFDATGTVLEAHPADLKSLAAAITSATGLKGRALYAPLRAALTGTQDGPELARVYALMGPDRARARVLDASLHHSGRKE